MEGLATGRIVHFERGVERGAERTCRAAIVTHVWGDFGTVNLWVFPDGINEPGGVVTSVYHEDQTNKLDSIWHWPERVD